MEALGCKTVADLQKVDVETLVKTGGALLGLRVWAERDGRILPLDPYQAYMDGAAEDPDFMQGCTKDEVIEVLERFLCENTPAESCLPGVFL